MAKKYSEAAQEKVHQALHEEKEGTLKSGSTGKKITSRKQAIAIGLSEAREEGKKVPEKKAATKKTAAPKKAAAKKTAAPKKTAAAKKSEAPKKAAAKKSAAPKKAATKKAS